MWEFYVHLSVFDFVSWLSSCQSADQILRMFYTPHERLCRSNLGRRCSRTGFLEEYMNLRGRRVHTRLQKLYKEELPSQFSSPGIIKLVWERPLRVRGNLELHTTFWAGNPKGEAIWTYRCHKDNIKSDLKEIRCEQRPLSDILECGYVAYLCVLCDYVES
jgi:hypothetical protein